MNTLPLTSVLPGVRDPGVNINYGHNRKLMEKCRRLEEYAIFVDMVRKNLAAGAPLEEAVTGRRTPVSIRVYWKIS